MSSYHIKGAIFGAAIGLVISGFILAMIFTPNDRGPLYRCGKANLVEYKLYSERYWRPLTPATDCNQNSFQH